MDARFSNGDVVDIVHPRIPKRLAFCFGVTGGRHPQMYGLAAAIVRNYEAAGYEVTAHFGFSGGAIVAALMASEAHKVQGQPEEWIRRSTPYGKHGKVDGINIVCSIWNLFCNGGLLKASNLYDRVFDPMLNQLELKIPAYAGTWSPSSNVEILWDLQKFNTGKGVCCSAALPFAISQMVVPNKELIDMGLGDVLNGIKDDLEGNSYFADAGISSSLGVGIIDGAEAVQIAEKESGVPLPVIGVNIDPIAPGHVSGFGEKSWYKKIWEACWGAIRANVLDDIREAKSERYLQLCVAPTPAELMKFSTKFDASLEDNLTLYRTGYAQGLAWLAKPLDGARNPIEAMDQWYEKAEAEAVANGAGSE